MNKCALLFLFLLFSVVLSGQCMIDSVYINAILVDPTGSNYDYDTNANGVLGSEDEYVEICNASKDSTIDLSGWQFGDDDSAAFPDFVMPDSTMIAPGECLLLVNNYCPDFGDPVDCNPPPGIININYSGTGLLGNSGDIIAMANADGSVSCSVVYGNVDCDSIDILDILPFDVNNCVSWGSDVDGCPLLVSGDSCTYLAQSLPVEFLDFGVERLNKEQVLIYWSTAQEINNDRFDVEWSTDARDFSLIGQVSAQPNSSERQDYQYVHTEPENGVNYYRLKQIDLDGTSEYTELRAINISKDEPPQIHPSLTRDFIRIFGNASAYDLTLFDMQGRVILTSNGVRPEQAIDLSRFESAYYMARISTGNESYFIPVFKY